MLFCCCFFVFLFFLLLNGINITYNTHSIIICDCFFISRYLEDLDEGIFIQQTLESILLIEDGKQLMVRIVFLKYIVISFFID